MNRRTSNTLRYLLFSLPLKTLFITANAFAVGDVNTFSYSPVYGGLGSFATPEAPVITLIRDADGRSPVSLNYGSGEYRFQYDSLNHRVVEKQAGSSLHLVFNNSLLPIAEFYPGETRYRFPGNSYFNVAKANKLITVKEKLGSVRGVISRGAVRARFDYDTTGRPNEQDNCEAECEARAYPYRFQGHRYLAFDDSESGYQAGIHDFSGRLYDHNSARFTHTDLLQQSYSPYTAMGDDWVNRIDPNGQYWFDILGPENQDNVYQRVVSNLRDAAKWRTPTAMRENLAHLQADLKTLTGRGRAYADWVERNFFTGEGLYFPHTMPVTAIGKKLSSLPEIAKKLQELTVSRNEAGEQKPLIIGMTGGPGSGKSRLAGKLADLLEMAGNKVEKIELDGYIKPIPQLKDLPGSEWFHNQEFIKDMAAVKSDPQKPLVIKKFDHQTGRTIPEKIIKPADYDILIFEGVLAEPKAVDITVGIHVNDGVRLQRFLSRYPKDQQTRFKEVFYHHQDKMMREMVSPAMNQADYIIDNSAQFEPIKSML